MRRVPDAETFRLRLLPQLSHRPPMMVVPQPNHGGLAGYFYPIRSFRPVTTAEQIRRRLEACQNNRSNLFLGTGYGREGSSSSPVGQFATLTRIILERRSRLHGARTAHTVQLVSLINGFSESTASCFVYLLMDLRLGARHAGGRQSECLPATHSHCHVACDNRWYILATSESLSGSLRTPE